MSAEADSDPADILPRFDMWNPEHEAIKFEVFDFARKSCPVAHTSADGGGQYLVTRYDDVRTVLENPQIYSSTGVNPRGASPVPLNPLDSDPPFQIELRKLLNPLFTRKFLLRYEPDLRANAKKLIAAFIDRGRFEFIQEFAAPFVGGALAKFAFNESDPAKMKAASDTVIRVAAEATDEAFFELAVLGSEYIVEREDNPIERDDVLNAITTGTIGAEKRPLSEDERTGVMTVLFLGGLDTTRGALSSIAYAIALDPELESRVRDPGWVRQDLDEFIRLASPVGCLGRTVMEDVELDGVALHRGDQVLIRYDSANRDETRFPDPDSFDFSGERPSNAGFGLGIHRCLGSHFARIQIAIAFDELLAQITNLRLARPDEPLHWAPGIANGLEWLELTFDRLESD